MFTEFLKTIKCHRYTTRVFGVCAARKRIIRLRCVTIGCELNIDSGIPLSGIGHMSHTCATRSATDDDSRRVPPTPEKWCSVVPPNGTAATPVDAVANTACGCLCSRRASSTRSKCDLPVPADPLKKRLCGCTRQRA
jgi:hypothetical protein